MRHRPPSRISRLAGTLAALLAASGLHAEADGMKSSVFEAGAYSFSDELGGFRILAVSGTGTIADPIVIDEELDSASPVTLTIRATRPLQPLGSSGNYATGFIPLRIVALNNSGHAWVEFQFELQEILNQPSVFSDGLSFDQGLSEKDYISSDHYSEFNREFEPFDRLLFRQGNVDPMSTVSFSFLVTDFTPTARLYLVQEPRIPTS